VTNSYRKFQFGYFRQSEVFHQRIGAVLLRFNRFREHFVQTAVRKLHRLIEYGTTLFFPPCSTFSLKCLLLHTVRHYRFFLFLIPGHDSTMHKEEIFYAYKIWLYHTLQCIYIIYIYIYIIYHIIIYDLAHICILYSHRIYCDSHEYSCNAHLPIHCILILLYCT